MPARPGRLAAEELARRSSRALLDRNAQPARPTGRRGRRVERRSVSSSRSARHPETRPDRGRARNSSDFRVMVTNRKPSSGGARPTQLSTLSPGGRSTGRRRPSPPSHSPRARRWRTPAASPTRPARATAYWICFAPPARLRAVMSWATRMPRICYEHAQRPAGEADPAAAVKRRRGDEQLEIATPAGGCSERLLGQRGLCSPRRNAGW